MNKDKEKNEKRCNLKCQTCQNYNRISDYCVEKEIKHCSKQVHTDFSMCDSYLVRENLIMF